MKTFQNRRSFLKAAAAASLLRLPVGFRVLGAANRIRSAQIANVAMRAGRRVRWNDADQKVES